MVVEDEVKITHVAEVATATGGSMPATTRKGEKIKPPPIPSSPARRPVMSAIVWYIITVESGQPSCPTILWEYVIAMMMHVQMGTTITEVWMKVARPWSSSHLSMAEPKMVARTGW